MRWLTPFFLFFLFLSGCIKEKKANHTLSRFVTENTAMVFEINDLSFLKDSLAANDFVTELTNFPNYQRIKKLIGFLKYAPDDSPGLLLFFQNDKDSLDVFYATNYNPDFFRMDSLIAKTVELLPIGKDTIAHYEVEGTQLYSKVINNHVLMGSSKEVLLTAGTKDLALRTDLSFEKPYQSSDKTKTATLFLNANKSEHLLSVFFKSLANLNTSSFKNWTAFDWVGGKNHIGLNGVGMFNDSLKNPINLFKNTEPLPNTTPLFAPKKSDAILSYSFENYSTFAKNQQHYLELSSPLDSPFSAVEEIGFIYLNSESALLLNTHGTENIADFLVGIRKKATDYQGNIILELSKTDFLNTSLRPIVVDFEANYATILENAFVFSKTKNILQTIISDYKKDNTFIKNPGYQEVLKKSVSAATLLSISNAKHLKKTLRDQLTKTNAEHLEKTKISDYTFTTQIVADGNYFHSNVSALQTNGAQSDGSTNEIVKMTLEQPLAATPKFVLNHLNKKNEIIAQDINNTLYLFSINGELLWKKELKSKIQGAIQQVDIFKNGRLQLAFTTVNEFLVLDRNGNEVALFNKSYKGTPLNPLAVFDYDKKREYRFVVTQGENIFMYDRKGKIVRGFKYTKAEKPIRDAPEHFVIGNKDYLAFLLEDGTFKAFNRRGEPRVSAKEKLNLSNNPLRLHKGKFTVTDKQGKLCQIDPKGNVKRIGLGLDEFHTMDATTRVLVYLNENILSINGKKTELDLGAYTRPQIFVIANKVFIAITDLQNQKVYVFDEQSKLFPNFPLYGNSTVDLVKLNDTDGLGLVTQLEDNSLAVYRLN